MKKRRITIIVLEQIYNRLLAEKARRDLDSPSSASLSDIVHDLLQKHLPAAEEKPKAPVPRKKPKKLRRPAALALNVA